VSNTEEMLEVALNLRAYLHAQDWPVDRIERIILAGWDGDVWYVQTLNASPTTVGHAEEYIKKFVKAVLDDDEMW